MFRSSRYPSSSERSWQQKYVGGETTRRAGRESQCKEEEEEISRLWETERKARRSSLMRHQAAEAMPDPEYNQPFFHAATNMEEVEVDMTARIAEFLNLYREEMARGNLEKPKATSGARVTAGLKSDQSVGMDVEMLSLLNKGLRCTLPMTSAMRSSPIFIWVARDGSELYWRHAGAGASGKPEDVILMQAVEKVGTKGSALHVRTIEKSHVFVADEVSVSKQWAKAISHTAKAAKAAALTTLGIR